MIDPTAPARPSADSTPAIRRPGFRALRIGTRVLLYSTLAVAVVASTLTILARTTGRFATPVVEVVEAIDRLSVHPTARDDLQTAAINGMLARLGDPYAMYVPPADAEAFDAELSGNYAGIGAEVAWRDGRPTIVTPLPDSPAWKAGILPGDAIVSIDGEPITPTDSLESAIQRIKGPPGTEVVLGVARASGTLDLTLTRETIRVEPVRGLRRDASLPTTWSYLLDPARAIVYIQLVTFTPGTTDAFRQALDAAADEAGRPVADLGGLILDVRGNPGGSLDEAIELADLFLSDGVIVATGRPARAEVSLSASGTAGSDRDLSPDPATLRRVRASGGGTLPRMPIVVLIDGGAASASEIVAGALVERPEGEADRIAPDAIAVGTRTYGKGSVQSVIELISVPDAYLKLTSELYYLPSGRSLQQLPGIDIWGVDPTPGFAVEFTMEQAIAARNARSVLSILRPAGEGQTAATDPTPVEPTPVEPAPVETNTADGPGNADPGPPPPIEQTEALLQWLSDPQLEGAWRALAGRVDSGNWTPLTDPAASEAERLRRRERAALDATRDRLLEELERIDARIADLDNPPASETEPEQPVGTTPNTTGGS